MNNLEENQILDEFFERIQTFKNKLNSIEISIDFYQTLQKESANNDKIKIFESMNGEQMQVLGFPVQISTEPEFKDAILYLINYKKESENEY